MFDKIKTLLQDGKSMSTLVISALMSLSPEQYIAIMGAVSALVSSMILVYNSYCDSKTKREISYNKHKMEMERYAVETQLLTLKTPNPNG